MTKPVRLIAFIFVSFMLLFSAPMSVGIRKANATAQKNSIPPETAREMAELEKFLSDSPSDPAGLF